jgi:hypothetical protein
LKKLQISRNFTFHLLGIASAERNALWFGLCFGWGTGGKNTTHAPAGFIRRTNRASIKGVAINCGWVGEARAGRVCDGNKIMPVLPYLNLLVVTARTAWFNFRGWKKRP